jgi:hypothetical protein
MRVAANKGAPGVDGQTLDGFGSDLRNNLEPNELGVLNLDDYDPNRYPTGVKITDSDYAVIPLRPHNWHGELNYSVAR